MKTIRQTLKRYRIWSGKNKRAEYWRGVFHDHGLHVRVKKLPFIKDTSKP